MGMVTVKAYSFKIGRDLLCRRGPLGWEEDPKVRWICLQISRVNVSRLKPGTDRCAVLRPFPDLLEFHRVDFQFASVLFVDENWRHEVNRTTARLRHKKRRLEWVSNSNIVLQPAGE